MEQTKKTNDAELINEVMRAAGKLREHEVPTGWPEMLRTDKAIKLAYALEAAGYLNEDWKPTSKLNKGKAVYILQKFIGARWRSSVLQLVRYWDINVVGYKATKDSNFISEINAIVAELRKEEKAEKMALDYIPESRNTGEETEALYNIIRSRVKMPYYLQKDLRKHLVAAIYSHLLTEKYDAFTADLDRVKSDIENEVDPGLLEETVFDLVEDIFERILLEVAEDMAALLCRVSQPIK